MSDWSTEDVLNFLECYQAEPCIWDPANSDRKDKKKVTDAWQRISRKCNKPVKELKIKKEILMVTFRKQLKRKQDSIRSGAGIEDIYEPSWFAYKLMESFLLPIYTAKMSLFSETYHTDSTSPTTPENNKRRRNVVERHSSINKQIKNHSNECEYLYTKKQHIEADSHFHVDDSRLRDECELYGLLLAKKLRKLDEHQRDIAMHEIDNIMFRAKMKTSTRGRESSSPTHSPETFPRKTESPIFIVTQYEDEEDEES